MQTMKFVRSAASAESRCAAVDRAPLPVMVSAAIGGSLPKCPDGDKVALGSLTVISDVSGSHFDD